MFGDRVWIHLDVGKLGLVALEVHLEVAASGESASTDVALERFLSWNRGKQNICISNLFDDIDFKNHIQRKLKPHALEFSQ